MNFDYMRMLTYIEMRNFIAKMMKNQIGSNLVIKVNSIKGNTHGHLIEFEVITSDGKHVTGRAYCTEFECKIVMDKTQTETIYTNDWAKFVYSIIKEKEFVSGDDKHIVSHNYKNDYNEHCIKIRNAKRAEIEQQCEQSLLK
ncbi:MAG: hypothetical protein ACLRFE_02770 [Clostridia bacterium]